MASSESNKKTKTPELNQDLISSLPTDLTDEILRHLPLSMAAKMSVLSRKWRHNWLSLKYLVFDEGFWEEHHLRRSIDCFDGQKISKIISDVLLHHTGPVYEFYLIVPNDPQRMILDLSPWLSFLSRAGIKKICLYNWVDLDWGPDIPSHIFECNELVSLKIDFYVLNAPPSEFIGFAYLRNLELLSVEFKHGVFRILISSCPRLTALRLEHCTGLTNLDFEHMPILENLVIKGSFAPLPFKNVFHLSSISLAFSWYSMMKASCVQRLETVNTIKTLAMPPVKLQHLHFDGNLCKFLAAGLNNKITLTFNHLQKLCLTQLNLDDFDVFCSIIGMVQSCPFIKDLELSINQMKKSDVQHRFVNDNDYKLRNLLEAKITGITESSAELKLIEYVLGISVVLERLLFKCHKLDPCSEVKVLRELLQLPRASTKAKLVCFA